MRKVVTLTIDADNRDNGKAFKITEMSAFAAERWAIRAAFALMNAGVDVPALDLSEGASMADLAAMGAEAAIEALAKVRYEDAEGLLADMMECAVLIPDPSKPEVVRRIEVQDVEEVSTLLKIRKAVWDLHVDFFTQGD